MTGVAVGFGVAVGAGVFAGAGEAVVAGGKLGIGRDSGVSPGVKTGSGREDSFGVSCGALAVRDGDRVRDRGPGVIARTGSKYCR